MKRFLSAGMGLILALSLVGCASAPSEAASASASAATAVASMPVSTVSNAGLEAYDLEYSNRDLDASYDAAAATKIDLSSAKGDVTIDAAGTYVLSGTMNGCVIIDISEEEKVQVVLAGVTITNQTGQCIFVKQADKCFITLAEGTTNTLTDGASYALEDGEDEPNAALFSKEDLTINGTGALSIAANYRHGIKSKDDLVITGGTITINAVEDALNGKDCVKICGGTFTLNAGEDGIQASNDTDAGRGFVAIDGGTFAITAGDDGIHAETLLRIADGNVDIQKSYEGLEGLEVRIDGGTVSAVSSDDGLNATNGSGNQMMGGLGGRGGQMTTPPDAAGAASTSAASNTAGMTPWIRINGGTIFVDAQGDGVDANGNVEMTGGVLLVSGPSNTGNGAFDYDGQATISGGTVIMAGAAGMLQSFSGGTQAFGMAQVQGSAGQKLVLKDASGKAVAEMTAARAFQMVVVSYAGASEGATATLEVNGNATNVPLSTTATAGGMGGMGGMGGKMGR